ncbi:MAG: ABC transporter substrate-binding protein [Nitrospinae bacterium]|nr:ABC transporter substrate-binding protein [Nitrospinota bacterium]
MTHNRREQTRRQFLTHTMGAAVGIYGVLHIAKPTAHAFPQPGAGGVPTSVDRMTVAVDGWGRDVINPVQPTGGAFLPDYFNLLLLMRDENQKIVPALATDWSLTDEGFQFAIHPRAKWHDGPPVTAEDIKWSFEAMRGDFSPQFKGHHAATRFKEQIGEVQVVDQKHVRITTKKPTPDFIAFYTGAGYHQVHLGPPHYLRQVGVEGYEKKPRGGGPYTVKDWKPGERTLLERWEDFWGDYPWYHKPQHQTLEFILAPDSAARFALLKSRQVDVAVNIPYGVAKDLPRSEAFERRGINPNKGAIWTQTITATGNYNLVFTGLQQFQNAPNKPTPEQLKPFDDIRVRQAMALALDKVAISEKAHFGFTKPMAGLWFTNAFGHRPGLKVSSYDPARAKQLLKEAGYPNGFSTTIYYGPFVNSPGIREWLEAAASFWKDVGIEVKIFEIETNQFYSQFARGQVPDWKWQPLAVQTWGRQEHGGVQATYGYHATGTYRCCFDGRSDELWQEASATTNEAVQLKALAELEDYVLQQHWVIPMTEVSIVIGYTDRVLAHPHPPHASSFEQFWRVVARK